MYVCMYLCMYVCIYVRSANILKITSIYQLVYAID